MQGIIIHVSFMNIRIACFEQDMLQPTLYTHASLIFLKYRLDIVATLLKNFHWLLCLVEKLRSY